ncbi:MAG TPA: metal ABC transporter substrate-binding protein [Burkholderiales bacterium]|nr:metal ABC transporter substrate-binding protein [Burkholderiales bacterium]
MRAPLLLVALLACARAAAAAPLPVAASILPLADFARQVGGGRVAVETLVPPGASPHTYEPTPAQLRRLSRARVLVLNGVGLEFWADKVIAAVGNPRLIVVRTADGLPLLGGDADSPGGNPHVWLSPRNAIHQVEAVRDALERADPAGAAAYGANAARYVTELHALDREIRAEVATFRTRRFIAFHAAWVYFARDYGLDQAGAIETSPGREPSPGEVAAIIRTAKAIGARAIFAEAEFPAQAARVIAQESGAKVLLLQVLGKPPTYRYLDTMRYDLAQMAEALR